MAFYDGFFRVLGLEGWCGGGASDAPLSMADLMAQSSGETSSGPIFPFPSLDNLNESCGSLSQTRDVTKGIEDGFLAAKPALKTVLDPIPCLRVLESIQICWRHILCGLRDYAAGVCRPLRCGDADPVDHLCLYGYINSAGRADRDCDVKI